MYRLSPLLVLVLTLGFAFGVQANDGQHLLFRAITQGDNDLAESLLRQGTSPDLTRADGTTALMLAARCEEPRLLETLLNYGSDAKLVNNAGETALHLAVGDPAKVRTLLAAELDVNATTKLGNTPLIIAAAYPGSEDIIRLLLEAGADATIRNKRGSSAVTQAVFAGNLEVVKHLLSLEGTSAAERELTLAAERGFGEIVNLLLEHGVQPNREGGRSPLHAALLAQRPDIASRLIESGAKLDGHLRPGNVPTVLLAAYHELGDVTVARRLIEAGVDLNEKNSFGETIADWARLRGNLSLLQSLEEAGANVEPNRRATEIPNREISVRGEELHELVRKAAAGSLKLMQHSSDVFLQERSTCISCHHQNLPSVALGWARARGIAVDESSIQRMIDAQIRSWETRNHRAYQMDRPVPVEPRFIGYGLLGFGALGYPQDDVTAALVWYLANIQQPDGHWVPGMLRPPLGGGEVTATVLAMRSLQLYPYEGREGDFRRRVAKARDWLQAYRPRYQQERAMRLLGLGWANVPANSLKDELSELVEHQRPDGGWAQLPNLESDAWATGQALVALRIGGGLSTDHPAYQRGIRFLLATRFDDGSWFVPHRTWPFQSHFESGFPHERDQWVSLPATAWATMALLLSLESTSDVRVVQVLTGARSEPEAAPPTSESTTDGPANFATVRKILARSCADCHLGEEAKGSFRLDSLKSLMAGGESGETILTPGNPKQSRILRYVSDQVEDLEMPPLTERKKYPALSPQEIKLLTEWIKQGADWPAGQTIR